MESNIRLPLAGLCSSLLCMALAACGGGGDAGPAPGAAVAPASSPSSAAATTVAACYDLSPAQGKTIHLAYRSTQFDAAGQPMHFDAPPETRVVGGSVEFEGHTATETTSTFHPADSPAYTSKAYWRQTGPAELTEYGSVSELVTGAVVSRSKSVYTPPLVTTFTAVPGASMTVSATLVTTATVNGVAQAPVTSPFTTTATFVGFEPVAIAAGTFDACRFEQRHQGPQGPVSTHWLLLGHGVELKISTPAFGGHGAASLELTLLLIDGTVPQ